MCLFGYCVVELGYFVVVSVVIGLVVVDVVSGFDYWLMVCEFVVDYFILCYVIVDGDLGLFVLWV